MAHQAARSRFGGGALYLRALVAGGCSRIDGSAGALAEGEGSSGRNSFSRSASVRSELLWQMLQTADLHRDENSQERNPELRIGLTIWIARFVDQMAPT